jgi:hypothetical protein
VTPKSGCGGNVLALVFDVKSRLVRSKAEREVIKSERILVFISVRVEKFRIHHNSPRKAR